MTNPRDEYLRLSFTPGAIRDHFEACEDDPTKNLTDDQLREAGEFALTSDALYSLFHDLLLDGITAVIAGPHKSTP